MPSNDYLVLSIKLLFYLNSYSYLKPRCWVLKEKSANISYFLNMNKSNVLWSTSTECILTSMCTVCTVCDILCCVQITITTFLIEVDYKIYVMREDLVEWLSRLRCCQQAPEPPESLRQHAAACRKSAAPRVFFKIAQPSLCSCVKHFNLKFSQLFRKALVASLLLFSARFESTHLNRSNCGTLNTTPVPDTLLSDSVSVCGHLMSELILLPLHNNTTYR